MSDRDGGGQRPPAAILDVDGTLVDTNYHHAVAWFRAFRAFDVTLPLYRIHRHIGMGGDQRDAELYLQLIGEVQPLAARASCCST